MTKTIKYRGQDAVITVELEYYETDATHPVKRHRITVTSDNNYEERYRPNIDLDLKEEVLKVIKKTKKDIDVILLGIITPDEEILYLMGFKK